MTIDDITVPTLASGLTGLETPTPRTPALHQLTLAALADLEGRAYWIDSRSTASTYTWLDGAISPSRLDPLRIARAFTAYQHHSLVQTTAGRATDDDLVVIPYLDALYADDDVPAPQARSLLADTLEALETLADAGTAVVVTASDTSIIERADHTITVRETDLGLAYEGPATETTVYRGPGFWQTTIPYWVDLFGIAEEETQLTATGPEPIQLALG